MELVQPHGLAGVVHQDVGDLAGAGEGAGECLHLRAAADVESVCGDSNGVLGLQLFLERGQALFPASHQDEVGPVAAEGSRARFADPCAGPRDENGLSLNSVHWCKPCRVGLMCRMCDESRPVIPVQCAGDKVKLRAPPLPGPRQHPI
jgi:hypothetical protein